MAITILCLTGGVTLVLKVVPLEAMIGILLWIGLTIADQYFREVPRQHGLVVVLGLIPTLAPWALLLINTTLRKGGLTLHALAPSFGSCLYIHGIIVLSQGFMISSLPLSAMMVFAIEGEFLKATL